MTTTDDELLKLAQDATPGPWHAYTPGSVNEVWGPDRDTNNPVVHWMGFDSAAGSRARKKANARFIAAASPDRVRALVLRVQRAEEALRRICASSGPGGHIAATYFDTTKEGE